MIKSAELWLVRHGKSPGKSDKNTEAQDRARVLSAKGSRQAVRAGKLLKAIAPDFDAHYSSPRVRCVQTADLIATQVGQNPQVAKVLDEQVETYPKRALPLIGDGECTLMVGHGPEWQSVIKSLTGRLVSVKVGGICAIQITNGQGKITKLLGPGDIKSML